MSEDQINPLAVTAEDKNRFFRVDRVFLKDLSFECPKAADILTVKGAQKNSLTITIEKKFRGDDRWEIILHVNFHSKVDDTSESVFIVEVQQGGIFFIRGWDTVEDGNYLLRRCVDTIFPFVREIIWSVVGRTGAPGLLLGPVEFSKVYDNLLQQELAKNSLADPSD